jgi:two-component system, OmpR family, sensor histidine kinase CiaH
MPFDRVGWRLAGWNLLILSLVLGITMGAAAISELAELHAEEPDGDHQHVEDEAHLFVVLGASAAGGLLLAGASSLFLADRAMRPIREAFERQRRFLADASHELRTPVAVVRTRAEVLDRESRSLPGATRQQLRLLRRDAEELGVLLDTLLDLAHLDGYQVEPALEPVALAEVAEEVVGHLRPLAQAREVRLDTQLTFVWGQANLAHVRQLLRALADNALTYTPAGGTVVVAVSREGNWACIKVADTGQGIAAEHLPRILEPFYRDHSAHLRAAGGAGLGLAIAARLVRLMRGRLQLDSTLGSGTTATVLLPLAPSGY